MAYNFTVDKFDLDAFQPDILFRVYAQVYAGHDPYATPYGGEDYVTDPVLEVSRHRVLRWTECGATLEEFSGARHRWVDLRPEAKQWASLTVRQALVEFRQRRERQLYVLKRQLARAEQERSLACAALAGLPSRGQPRIVFAGSPVTGE